MQKKVAGKVYCTEDSRHLARAKTAFDYWNDLYMDWEGEYFLHEHPVQPYFFSLPHLEHEITKLTEEEAREWVEHFCSRKDYEEVFESRQ